MTIQAAPPPLGTTATASAEGQADVDAGRLGEAGVGGGTGTLAETEADAAAGTGTGTGARAGAGPDEARRPRRIVILISGRGSNMQAIVRACTEQRWAAQVVAVIADRGEAAGLAFAQAHGIATAVVDFRTAASRQDFDHALSARIDAHAPDLLLLAGFMRILGAPLVARHTGRMLNIHPSLLPAFTGLHTHRRALAAGCQAVGATVHFVTPELDHGPIVLQAVVPVQPGDDEAALAARVLAREHLIYPQAVRWFVEGRLRLEADGRVRQLDGASQVLI